MHLGEKGYEFSDKAFQAFLDPFQEELVANIEYSFEQYAEEVDAKVQQSIKGIYHYYLYLRVFLPHLEQCFRGQCVKSNGPAYTIIDDPSGVNLPIGTQCEPGGQPIRERTMVAWVDDLCDHRSM